MTEPIVSISRIKQLAQEHARASHNTSYHVSCPYPLGTAAAEIYAQAFDDARTRIAVVQQSTNQTPVTEVA
ncbi:hypothetical protein [Limnohabitans sp.]|uniref:hypothetical protein n=1 Tax=Limnohabitans sp. TaxID=1907725 RepID=UPI00286ED652|nr:hypothetical protein [Limnohabitans sp.]